MKYLSSVVILALLVISTMPVQYAILDAEDSNETSGRATGVDVGVIDYAFSYTNSVDEGNYRMFSSNHPIIGFNRPANLFVIDAMVDKPIHVDIDVENFGTAPSGTIDVQIRVLHNDYTQFEIINDTVQMNSLSGGTFNTVSTSFIPTYSGNHTIEFKATSTVADDDSSNDKLTGPFTVGFFYYNCNTLTNWTAGTPWQLSNDAAISKGSGCHAGSGSSSTYANNLNAALYTPVWDMSDSLANPSRTQGFSFFYTGSASQGDFLKMYSKTPLGGWHELGTITGTIDNSFTDGSSWQTFSVNNLGHASPVIPVPAEHFHSQSQFKFVFESDASGSDIGYWIDDLVFIYDQKVRKSEYNLSSQGIHTIGSLPDEWGEVRMEVFNSGNITDTIIPEVNGLPAGWEIYYAYASGIGFDHTQGIEIAPGSSTVFNIMLKPDANETIGFKQMDFKAYSTYYNDINTTKPINFQVLADRVPHLVHPDPRPSCPPGSSCTFEVELQNIGEATDTFNLDLNTDDIPGDWTVAFAWDQDTSVVVRPDTPVSIQFVLTIPSTATPDTIKTAVLTATSSFDSNKLSVLDLNVQASMISDAEVAMSEFELSKDWSIEAGATKTLTYTIWNNASRQDIFSMSVDYDSNTQWIVEQPTRPDAVINPGMSTTFTVKVTAPDNAQAGDSGPSLTPVITSQRSQMQFEGPVFDELIIIAVEDLKLTLLETPNRWTPGTASLVRLEIENDGNGDTTATLDIPDMPESWDWWMWVDDTNSTEGIDLSVSYDLQDVKEIHLYVLLPFTESASEVISLTITVSGTIGEDINPEDNSVTVESITAAVRKPDLRGTNAEIHAQVGSVVSANATLQNVGNAADSEILVKATISTSPPVNGIVGFLMLGDTGASRGLDDYVQMSLQAGEEIDLGVDLILPDDTNLNTRIVVKFEVIGGKNDEFRPYELEFERLILVDSQRKFTVVTNSVAIGPYDHDEMPDIWINLTSLSSYDENMAITANIPEGWQAMCGGILLNQSGYQFTMSAGVSETVEINTICNVNRVSGVQDGIATFTVSSLDGEISWTNSQSLAFNEAPVESAGFSVMELGIGAGIVLVAFVLAILAVNMNKKKKSSMEEIKPVESLSAASQIEASSIVQTAESAGPIASEPVAQVPAGPPLPEGGLPEGWTMQQWQYYGQQYLDGTL